MLFIQLFTLNVYLVRYVSNLVLNITNTGAELKTNLLPGVGIELITMPSIQGEGTYCSFFAL